MPQTIQKCLGEEMKNKYLAQVPTECVADLNKAAKIGLRLQNEKKNAILFSKGKFQHIQI